MDPVSRRSRHDCCSVHGRSRGGAAPHRPSMDAVCCRSRHDCYSVHGRSSEEGGERDVAKRSIDLYNWDNRGPLFLEDYTLTLFENVHDFRDLKLTTDREVLAKATLRFADFFPYVFWTEQQKG
ncbi:hypothetical protein ACP4OV_030564 [Aristida adscensionis]